MGEREKADIEIYGKGKKRGQWLVWNLERGWRTLEGLIVNTLQIEFFSLTRYIFEISFLGLLSSICHQI